MIQIHWIWLLVAGMVGGVIGLFGMAMLSAGSRADEWWEGYQCGRDEACEHVMHAEKDLKKLRKKYTHLENLYYIQYWKRYEVGERLHNMRAERRLLRQMAGLDGEDV